MNKKLIRLTESDLHSIVKKSLKRVLSETEDYNIDRKYFDNDESWKAKKYQDERDKYLTNPNYVGTPSFYDPTNYQEVEQFVDDEEDGSYKEWMDEIGYEGVTNNDSIYNIKGNFSDLANKQREHLLNRQTKPWLHNESKNMNKKLIRLTESDLHSIVKESVNRILNEYGIHKNVGSLACKWRIGPSNVKTNNVSSSNVGNTNGYNRGIYDDSVGDSLRASRGLPPNNLTNDDSDVAALKFGYSRFGRRY